MAKGLGFTHLSIELRNPIYVMEFPVLISLKQFVVECVDKVRLEDRNLLLLLTKKRNEKKTENHTNSIPNFFKRKSNINLL